MQKSRLAVCLLTAAMVVLSAASPGRAQTPTDRKAVRLTLADALRVALENNLDLIIAKTSPKIAEQQVEVERAPFDGTFAAELSYVDTDDSLKIADQLTGGTGDGSSTAEIYRGTVSWSQLLNFGATYTVDFSPQDLTAGSRSVNASTGFFADSLFAQDNYPLLLTFRMPLLKNLGRQVNTERLVLAGANRDTSLEDLRGEAQRVLQEVEGAYWSVVAATEALRTENLALERAEDLLELNRKKVEVGTLAPIEITQAEAGVASQQEGVIVAETTLLNAEDELRRLLAIPPDDPAWSMAIDASDRPRYDERSVDVEAAMATALEQRPEVINVRRRLSNNELSENVARKQRKHTLDLVADVTPSGTEESRTLAQTLSDGTPLPPSVTATNTDGLNWRLALNYTVPFNNRAAKANYAIASLTRERTELEVQNVEQNVRVEVRQAARNVESGIKRVEAARKNVELQQEKLDAEEKKFENGMSTSFEVLTFQNDLANAELSLIRAGLDYVNALAALERAKGTLLAARDLELDMDGE